MQPSTDAIDDALPRALARSLGLHARWLATALAPGDAVAHRGRRALTLAAGFPPYAALQLGHSAGFLLDALLFRREREQAIEAPIFVLGIPRSGTTFVHRLLAADSERLSSARAWEAVLAPSVSERRFWRALGVADSALGAPGRRLRDRLLRRLGSDFAAVHPIAADAAEEDYLLMLPLAGCFLAALAAPESPALWRLTALQRAPAAERALLLGAYRRLLQKQLYADGGRRRLLSKNAAFASWAGALARVFPDARFIVCVREPEAALGSQLSAIAPALRALGVSESAMANRFAQVFADGYGHLADTVEALPARTAVVDNADLRAAPGATLGAALSHLGVAPSATLAAVLARAGDEAAAGRQPAPRPAPAGQPRPPQTLLAAMQRDYQRLRARRPSDTAPARARPA